MAMTLCVSTLIASEFLPVSLLSPIAADIEVSPGQAGQGIAVSGLFAVITSLFIVPASRGMNRRTILLWLVGLMIVSGTIVTFAPSYLGFMAGRALLGVVIGGFWSMSTATIMRLVPESEVPRALALLNGGNALASTVAAPLGIFLGQFIGWRGAFFCVVLLATVTLVWLLLTLPSMPAKGRASGMAAFKILRRPQVPWGMAAVALLFMGQFALFTYLRPFLEVVTDSKVSTISLMLLGLGIAGLAGTYAISIALGRTLFPLLVGMPIAMTAVASGLIVLRTSPASVTVLLAAWGLIGTAAPVAWWTWLSRVMPDEAESGGGLMVAVIQISITLGAALGGIVFDNRGYQTTFAFSAILLVCSALMALFASRQSSAASANEEHKPFRPSTLQRKPTR